MERIKVKSSNISSIGYDELTKTLEIEFANGGLYQYKEVPKEVYEGFNKAESVGKYFFSAVKAKNFAYLKVERFITLIKRADVQQDEGLNTATFALEDIVKKEMPNITYQNDMYNKSVIIKTDKAFYEKHQDVFKRAGYEVKDEGHRQVK